MILKPDYEKYISYTFLVLGMLSVGMMTYEINKEYTLENGDVISDYQGTSIEEIKRQVQHDIPDITEFSAIVERPLFMADRRPHVTGNSTVNQLTLTDPVDHQNILNVLSLQAVIITDDEQIALIELRDQKTVSKYKVGDTVNGWRVTGIQDKSVTLSLDGEVQSLPLLIATSPSSRAASTQRQPVQEPALKPRKDTDVAAGENPR